MFPATLGPQVKLAPLPPGTANNCKKVSSLLNKIPSAFENKETEVRSVLKVPVPGILIGRFWM
jgi:hypothetical protein